MERVGIHDNFFDLGGDSLLGTQVMSRVRDEFQVPLFLRAIFEALVEETDPAVTWGLPQTYERKPLSEFWLREKN